MKYYLLISLFFYAAFSQAQVPYTPFDFESSRWTETNYQVWFFKSFYEVHVDGDTLIDNLQYYKLKAEGVQYEYDSPWQDVIVDSTIIDGYWGFIRENDQKQIEAYSLFTQSPYVLYDFNKKLGDTIYVDDIDFGLQTAVINSVDTVLICGAPRNRYCFQFVGPYASYQCITEGIGSSAGIIPSYEFFESGTWSTCFSKGNCDCGELISAQHSPVIHNASKIYPNPVKDEFTIEMSDGKINYDLTIFDIYGRKVLQINIDRKQIRIPTRSLNSGAYFMLLQGDEWEQWHKIIKQ